MLSVKALGKSTSQPFSSFLFLVTLGVSQFVDASL
jgi:hypothetical protein